VSKLPPSLEEMITNSMQEKVTYIKGISQSRKESNKWLRENCKDIKGKVLSIGSMNDRGGTGHSYKDYFQSAESYTTSDIEGDVDLILDVTNMKFVKDGEYDCVYLSGVLEHVPDFMAGVREIKRVLKKGGMLILGVPFNQSLHSTDDYWRFSPYALHYMFSDFEILNIKEINRRNKYFPGAYWIKAKK
jgi:SAM-dependent methyltransferase